MASRAPIRPSGTFPRKRGKGRRDVCQGRSKLRSTCLIFAVCRRNIAMLPSIRQTGLAARNHKAHQRPSPMIGAFLVPEYRCMGMPVSWRAVRGDRKVCRFLWTGLLTAHRPSPSFSSGSGGFLTPQGIQT